MHEGWIYENPDDDGCIIYRPRPLSHRREPLILVDGSASQLEIPVSVVSWTKCRS